MTTGSLTAAPRRTTRLLCGALLVASLVALVPVQRAIDGELSLNRRMAEVLYLPSGKVLRLLSLGHEGLLADIYWTRVVQYFGRKRIDRETRYDLLGPLLRITTELDPHLVIAYRFGAIFLGEKAPRGAGQPEEALQLLRQGIVANPDYWRLWQDLGFIYYWDLKDYKSAARAFQAGSERPGAMAWMKALAATVAAEGGEIRTSRLLWSEIYRQADNDQIRKSAEEHLLALQAQEEMQALNALLQQYRQRQGYPARSFRDLVTAGLLSAMPLDPTGAPYRVGSDGQAALSPKSGIDLGLLQ
jgi:tetratricopeptide (TPR) repeat protein